MRLLRSNHRILSLLLVVLAAVSCSVQKRARAEAIATIDSHREQKDIVGLIKDLSLFPAYRDEAEEALFTQIDYSLYNYAAISLFDDAAQDDFRAAAFFDSLKVDFESKALEYISNSSIEGAGAYYKENSSLQQFLYPYLQEAYFSRPDTLDYKTLKSLYTSFEGSDLSKLAYPHYQELRNDLLTEISEALDKYFSSEKEMLDDIEYSIRKSADAYVKSGTKSITSSLLEKNSRTFGQKVFKRQAQDNYSFGEYANILINKYYKPTYITDKVVRGLNDFIVSSTDFRMDICQQYLSNIDSSLFVTNTVDAHQLIWEIGKSHIEKVEDIKNTGAALAVGSLALGFVPGIGAIALAADIADLAYGLTQDSRIDETMSKLTNAMYGDSLESIDEYLQSVFGDIRAQRINSENNLRKRLYEEF